MGMAKKSVFTYDKMQYKVLTHEQARERQRLLAPPSKMAAVAAALSPWSHCLMLLRMTAASAEPTRAVVLI